MLNDAFDKMQSIMKDHKNLNIAMQRYDEMIMDKAYTYDIISIRKQLDKMLPKNTFEELANRYSETEKLCKNKFKYYDEEVLRISDITANNYIKIEDTLKLLDEMQIQ